MTERVWSDIRRELRSTPSQELSQELLIRLHTLLVPVISHNVMRYDTGVVFSAHQLATTTTTARPRIHMISLNYDVERLRLEYSLLINREDEDDASAVGVSCRQLRPVLLEWIKHSEVHRWPLIDAESTRQYHERNDNQRRFGILQGETNEHNQMWRYHSRNSMLDIEGRADFIPYAVDVMADLTIFLAINGFMLTDDAGRPLIPGPSLPLQPTIRDIPFIPARTFPFPDNTSAMLETLRIRQTPHNMYVLHQAVKSKLYRAASGWERLVCRTLLGDTQLERTHGLAAVVVTAETIDTVNKITVYMVRAANGHTREQTAFYERTRQQMEQLNRHADSGGMQLGVSDITQVPDRPQCEEIVMRYSVMPGRVDQEARQHMDLMDKYIELLLMLELRGVALHAGYDNVEFPPLVQRSRTRALHADYEDVLEDPNHVYHQLAGRCPPVAHISDRLTHDEGYATYQYLMSTHSDRENTEQAFTNMMGASPTTAQSRRRRRRATPNPNDSPDIPATRPRILWDDDDSATGTATPHTNLMSTFANLELNSPTRNLNQAWGDLDADEAESNTPTTPRVTYYHSDTHEVSPTTPAAAPRTRSVPVGPRRHYNTPDDQADEESQPELKWQESPPPVYREPSAAELRRAAEVTPSDSAFYRVRLPSGNVAQRTLFDDASEGFNGWRQRVAPTVTGRSQERQQAAAAAVRAAADNHIDLFANWPVTRHRGFMAPIQNRQWYYSQSVARTANGAPPPSGRVRIVPPEERTQPPPFRLRPWPTGHYHGESGEIPYVAPPPVNPASPRTVARVRDAHSYGGRFYQPRAGGEAQTQAEPSTWWTRNRGRR